MKLVDLHFSQRRVSRVHEDSAVLRNTGKNGRFMRREFS
jgi:hypothetical protein